MKYDSKWTSPARRPFRVLALILAMLFLSIGIGGIISDLVAGHPHWNHNVRFYIAAFGWGIFFLIVALRGRLGRTHPKPQGE